jgi:hypothetical protein
MTRISDAEPLLTGNEKYPITGHIMTTEAAIKIQSYFGGLKKYWHCLEKALICRQLLKFGTVVVGEMRVISGDGSSAYGYNFNPPFEFHAWLQLPDGNILDFALPGVIEKGLNTSDEHGPFLTGVEPFILVGLPTANLFYLKKEIYRGGV